MWNKCTSLILLYCGIKFICCSIDILFFGFDCWHGAYSLSSFPVSQCVLDISYFISDVLLLSKVRFSVSVPPICEAVPPLLGWDYLTDLSEPMKQSKFGLTDSASQILPHNSQIQRHKHSALPHFLKLSVWANDRSVPNLGGRICEAVGVRSVRQYQIDDMCHKSLTSCYL